MKCINCDGEATHQLVYIGQRYNDHSKVADFCDHCGTNAVASSVWYEFQMTVAELIAKLQTFDPTMFVVCGPNGYDSSEASRPDPTEQINVEMAYPVKLPKAVVL